MLNFNISMLLIPLSGAAIGFFTNWIAIKMLFHPHEEKRLFGVVLLFTPGVIPKRRAELAKKLGAATGEYILTSDTLTTALTSPENADNLGHRIADFINNSISDAKNSPLTVEEYLRIHVSGADMIIEKVSTHITASVQTLLLSKAFRAELVCLIHARIIEHLKDGIIEQHLAAFLHSNREQIKTFINEQYMADNLLNNETPISEYLGENQEKAQAALSNAAAKHLPELISDHLRNNESLSAQLETLIQQIIDNSLNPITRAFVNPSKILATLKANVLDFLANEAKVQKLIDSGMGKATTYLQLPVSFYAAKLRDHAPLIQKCTDNLSDCVIDALIDKCAELPISQLADKHHDKLPDFLDKYIERMIPVLSSFVIDYLETAKTRLLNERVSELAEKLHNNNTLQLHSIAHTLAAKSLVFAAPLVVKFLDINKIVESQINSFDIATIESLALSVVKRELRVVISLGGILGFLVGIIVLFLQHIF